MQAPRVLSLRLSWRTSTGMPNSCFASQIESKSMRRTKNPSRAVVGVADQPQLVSALECFVGLPEELDGE